jgi:hypothetical protein
MVDLNTIPLAIRGAATFVVALGWAFRLGGPGASQIIDAFSRRALLKHTPPSTLDKKGQEPDD